MKKLIRDMSENERELTVSDAMGIIRQDYYDDVRSMADSIKDELRDRIKDGESGEGLREWLMEHIHESIDGCARVIYTAQAQQGLLVSDNDGAYVEDFGPDGMVDDGQIQWSRLMYAAMERDVIEQLDADGCDVNSPEDFEKKEDATA